MHCLQMCYHGKAHFRFKIPLLRFTMKSILIELGYRGLYILLTYIGIELCFYFSFGYMCEYILAACQYHYQTIDFGFYNLLQHYSNPYIHSKSGNFLLNDDHYKELSYQSKSWGLLGLSSASYLHQINIAHWLQLWYYKVYPLLFIFAFQYVAFMYPGVHKNMRNRVIAWSHMLIFSHILCTLAIPLFVTIGAEFQIEPFDSELISIA